MRLSKRGGCWYNILPPAAAAVAVLLYTLPLVRIFPFNPEDIIYRQLLVNADAIVVLEGEYKIRIDRGIELLEAGYAPVVYIPGLHYGPNERYLAERMEESSNLETRVVVAEKRSHSTFGEAVKTRKFALKHGFDRILLVTSNQHSFRAWWIFERVLGGRNRVDIVSVPVREENSWYKPEKVKKRKFAYRVFKSEQRKFLVYYFVLKGLFIF